MIRTTRATALLLACPLVLAACSGAPSPAEDTSSSTEDVVIAGTFPGAGYYQIDYATPWKGEISLIMLAPGKTFWGELCVDAKCAAPERIGGTYTFTRTKLHLYDANEKSIGTWSYRLEGGTLWLQKTGASYGYALDPMSEDLCDSSGGAWSDDDLAAHGFNCTCPDDQDWGPGGCERP